jgi:fructokinase
MSPRGDTAALVIGIGELLWDLRPDGATIGGAPFNATAHLAALGYRAAYTTAVGRDELGAGAIGELRARGIETCLVAQADGLPTGVAHVALDEDGSPAFALASPAAYEALCMDSETIDTIVEAEPAIVVIGTLAHRSQALLADTQRLLARLPQAICVYDVNLRDGCWTPETVVTLAHAATALKLSRDEAETIAAALGDRWAGLEAFCHDAAARFGLRAVAITDGPRDAALLLDGVLVTLTPPPVQVLDSIGAGDAFTAALADGLHRGMPPEPLLARANELGALVATVRGALPDRRPTITEGRLR